MKTRTALGIGLAALLGCASADNNAEAPLEEITLVCHEGDEGELSCHAQGDKELYNTTCVDNAKKDAEKNIDRYILAPLVACWAGFIVYDLVQRKKREKEL